MKGSIITISFFITGCLVGTTGLVHFDVHNASVYVLYVLMLLIGANIGGNMDLKAFVGQLNFKTLLVPIATITGTAIFAALGAIILSQWSVFDCMAVGSGLCYYSVSSMLIAQLKSPSLGVQLATELSTIALLANIIREMTALVAAPLIRKYFGTLAPISAAGMSSGDVALNAVAKYSGKEVVPIAIVHGILVNLSVPFIVSMFCNM